MESIRFNPVSSCSSLKTIEVSAENTHFTAVDGVLFNRDKTLLIACCGAKSGNISFRPLLLPSETTRFVDVMS